MQFVFQLEQSFLLAFQQLGHRNMRPAADHGGDIFFAYLFLDEPVARLA